MDITWRNTKMREGPNNIIIVPNAKLASATVTNYYQPNREVDVPVPVHVNYENDFVTVDRRGTGVPVAGGAHARAAVHRAR